MDSAVTGDPLAIETGWCSDFLSSFSLQEPCAVHEVNESSWQDCQGHHFESHLGEWALSTTPCSPAQHSVHPGCPPWWSNHHCASKSGWQVAESSLSPSTSTIHSDLSPEGLLPVLGLTASTDETHYHQTGSFLTAACLDARKGAMPTVTVTTTQSMEIASDNFRTLSSPGSTTASIGSFGHISQAMKPVVHLSPIEEGEKMRRRRERNKVAATKCRLKRRARHTSLFKESETLDKEYRSLKDRFEELVMHKQTLEDVLERHRTDDGCCLVDGTDGDCWSAFRIMNEDDQKITGGDKDYSENVCDFRSAEEPNNIISSLDVSPSCCVTHSSVSNHHLEQTRFGRNRIQRLNQKLPEFEHCFSNKWS